MNYLIVAAILCTIGTYGTVTAKYNYKSIPLGTERIYDYRAVLHVGTYQPDHFASAFHISGHLHVQQVKENLLSVYLSDLKYNLHNGRVTPEHRLHNETWGPYLPVPAEVQPLTLPFQIIHDEHNKLSELIVDEHDKEFSINMKKSIASVIQIEVDALQSFEGHEFVKIVPEDTVYGMCDIKYLIEPKDDAFVLVKTFEPEDCQNHFELKRNKNFMSFENVRVYRFKKLSDNEVEVNEVEVSGVILTYPQAGMDGVHFTKAFQRIVLTGENASPKLAQIENKQTLKSLKYTDPLEKCREMPLNAKYDLTGGRRTEYKSEKLLEFITQQLTDYNNYLKENHISFEKPAEQNIRTLYKMLIALEQAPIDMLEQIFNLLQEKSASDPNERNKLYLYVQLLPHVGTKASVILIRNLIRKQKIDPSLAIMILKDVPTHLKCPSEKLLTELEDLLTLHKDDKPLHNALILTFASLVRKTFEHFDEKSAMLEKHIKYFVEKMNTATDYHSKVQYLQALANIKIGSVFAQLMPIVRGEVQVDENLRIVALQVIGPYVLKDFTQMYKIVLPILANRALSTALRAAAYTIYINTQPTYDSFLKLHLLFRTEPNERLYAFHYNTLRAMSELSAPAFNDVQRTLASVMLRFSRHPVNDVLVDGTYFYEHLNTEYGFGTQVRDILVDNEKDIIIHSKMVTRLNDVNYEMFSIYLRVNRRHKGSDPFGFKKPVSDDLKKDSPVAINFPFEVIIRRGDRTIMTYSGDVVTVEVIRTILRNFNILFNKDLTFPPVLQIPFLYERVVPTDLGIPIRFTEQLPIVQKFDVHFDAAGSKKFTLDLKLTVLAHRALNMKVYNPISDLYHGIVDAKSVAINLPLHMVFEKGDNEYSVSFLKKKEGEAAGLQLYGTTRVYINGIHSKEELAKFNKDEDIFQTVLSNQLEYQKKIPIVDATLNGIGKRFEAAFFNCQRPVSRGSLIYELTADDPADNSEPSLSLILMTIQQYLILTPGIGECGINVQLHDLPDVDHVELSLKSGTAQALESFTKIKSFFDSESTSLVAKVSTKTADNKDLMSRTIAFETKSESRDIKSDSFKIHVAYSKMVKDELKRQVFFHIDHKQVTNHFETKLTMDVTSEKSVLEMKVDTQLSDEQQRMIKEKNFIYKECFRQAYKHILLPYNQECARVASSLNKYSVDMTVNNYQHEEVILLLRSLGWFRSRYYMYRQPFGHMVDFPHNKHYHLDLVFPIYRDEYDIELKTDSGVETYKGIPRELVNFDNIFLQLMSPFFVLDDLDDFHDYTYLIADYRHCLINAKYLLTDNYNVLPEQLQSEYSPAVIAKMENDSIIYSIAVKSIDDTGLLAFKIEYDEKSLEVIPSRDGYTINGKPITWETGKEEFDGKFTAYVAPYPKLLLVAVNHNLIHVTFDDTTMRLDMPHVDVHDFSGKCIQHKH